MRKKRKQMYPSMTMILIIGIVFLGLYLIVESSISQHKFGNFNISKAKENAVIITDLKVDRQNRTYEPGEVIKVTFKVDNNEKIPVKVKINKEYYNIIKETNSYVVLIDASKTSGKTRITIESMEFEDGTSLKTKNNGKNQITVKVVGKTEKTPEYKQEQSQGEINNLTSKPQASKKPSVAPSTPSNPTLKPQPSPEPEPTPEPEPEPKPEPKPEPEPEPEPTPPEVKEEKIISVTPDTYYQDIYRPIFITYEIDNVKGPIKGFLINGEEHEILETNGNKYTSFYITEGRFDVYQVNLTKIIYTDGTTHDIEYTLPVEVIKTSPVISDYKTSFDVNKETVNISFNYRDTDNVSSDYHVTFNNQRKEIRVGSNQLTFDIAPNKNYSFKVISTYDLDSNRLNFITGNKNSFVDGIISEKNIYMGVNLSYKIKNLKTANAVNDTTYFEQGEDVYLLFDVINTSSLTPHFIIIDDKEYKIDQKGTRKRINIGKYSKAGIHKIKLDKINFGNNHTIALEENNEATFDVLKVKPTITNFKYSKDNNLIRINFSLNDKDIALTKTEFNVFDENQNVIKTIPVIAGENEVFFEMTASRIYYANALVDYCLDNAPSCINNHENQVLLNESIQLDQKEYQLKDITNLQLYSESDNGVNQNDEININDLKDLSKYVLKINMKDLPALYAEIKSYKVENDTLKFTIKADNFIQYRGDKKEKDIILDYGEVKNDIATSKNNSKADSSAYIPDLDRLKLLSDYDSDREMIYSNLYKIMPFYNTNYLVDDGNLIDKDNILNKKEIKTILSFNKNKKQVVALTNQNYLSLTSIKIVFKDNTSVTYSLSQASRTNFIANYTIDELNIGYNFNKYIVNTGLDAIEKLSNKITNYDYTKDLDPLTNESDSRLYRDYYNEFVKPNINEFIYKLVANIPEYNLYLDNDIVQNKIVADITDNDNLKQLLYAYNYYSRWYNFDIGNINLRDTIFFDSKLLNNTITPKIMAKEVLLPKANRATGATQTFYQQNMAKHTGKNNIGTFIEFFVKEIGGYADADDWFSENFSGLLKEIPVDGHSEINYRAWNHLKNKSGYLLPILTLPKDSAYLISSASQFLIGAQRTYIADPNDPVQKQQLINKINNYSNYIASFYNTTAGFIPAKYINPHSDIQVDRRVTVAGMQSPGTTEEPFHKNFTEAVGAWANNGLGGANANGTLVIWNNHYALDSLYTWSHESAHNQDSKIFLMNKGRRGWAEDYADGNLSQGFNDGEFNMNLMMTYNKDANITTNLTPERINSSDKIHSFYKRLFEASDFLDYLEAKAFLTLSPEEQSKVAVQISYPKVDYQEDGGEITKYSVISAEQFRTMNLQTVEDLWNNHITIKPGVTNTLTNATDMYGSPSLYTRTWYQPHNDFGRPDSFTMKQLAWEMLGIGGYEGGYVTYYSGYSQTDLEAIQNVTKNYIMTWKKYKMNRYELMENNKNKISIISADKVFSEYQEALKKDAANNDRNVSNSTNVKRTNYYLLKRTTDDFRSEIFN